jgi:hypothetical protein
MLGIAAGECVLVPAYDRRLDKPSVIGGASPDVVPLSRDLDLPREEFPESGALHAGIISLPVHQKSLTVHEMGTMAGAARCAL